MSQRLTEGDENPICHPDPELDSGVSASLRFETLKPLNQVKGQHDKGKRLFSDEI